MDPRPFVTIEEGAGHPDGLTVDADGGVWVALNGGGAVRGYDAEGRLSETVEVPVRQVTACAFGGEGLEWLVHHDLAREPARRRRACGRVRVRRRGRRARHGAVGVRRLRGGLGRGVSDSGSGTGSTGLAVSDGSSGAISDIVLR